MILRERIHSISAMCVLFLLHANVVAQEQSSQADRQQSIARDTVSFFEMVAVSELKLVLDGESQQRLRDTPREYSRASLIENGVNTLKSVGVKLKGAAGSYRDFDDRPGLTLNIGKYKKDQRFHGMEKFHLNNAVQDDSLLNEWLGAEVFRIAGLPAPRASHVRLWINERDMGIYVLREGFEKSFLRREFSSTDGNLYDGGFVQDIDSQLELDIGEDIDDRADLIGLALACYQPNPVARKSTLASRVDIDRFLSFMAVERIIGHWDGYTLNMNNYRIFFPTNGKGVFLPHGMDQIFGDAGAGLYDHSKPLVAAAVMQNDEWRGQYRQRLMLIADKLKAVEPLLAKIDERHNELRPVLESINPDLASAHSESVKGLKDRVRERFKLLPELIEHGMPEPSAVERGVVSLGEWYPSVEADDVRVEEMNTDGRPSYSIMRERFGDFSSSWRTSVLLQRGNYVFEARVKTEDVIPIPDELTQGAGIRLSSSGRLNHSVTTQDWTLVTHPFTIVEDQRQIELVLELRARLGKAWFDRESIIVRQINK